LWLNFYFINSQDTIFTEQWNKTCVCISFPHWKSKRSMYAFVANTIIIFISFPLSSSPICYILPLSMCFPSLCSLFQIPSSQLLLRCCCLDSPIQWFCDDDYLTTVKAILQHILFYTERRRFFYNDTDNVSMIFWQWLLDNLNWIWYITLVR